MPNLLSTADVNRIDIDGLFQVAETLHANPQQYTIDTAQQGALLFFESSTRTRFGFETASWQLGVKTISLYETKQTDTMSAAESIADTIRTLNPLVTYFGVRHYDSDIFDKIVPYTSHPVINCGSGDSQHPTQALIDAFTMHYKFSDINGLQITMTGALRHSRAARSLLGMLAHFSNISIAGFTEPELHFSEQEIAIFLENGTNQYHRVNDMTWGSEQVVYSAGFPPKNASGTFDQHVRDRYKITTQVADEIDEGAIIMNPLPRIDEIDTQVDELPQAYYFMQNELALAMRKAILMRYCLQT